MNGLPNRQDCIPFIADDGHWSRR